MIAALEDQTQLSSICEDDGYIEIHHKSLEEWLEKKRDQNNKVNTMEFKLTKSQQRTFAAIESSNENFLIQGKPGVGKSVLIRALMKDGNKSYTLAAPTGLAALNIGGRTLHSIFRLPVSGGITHHDYNNFTTDDKVINMIKYNINHLIIDEVSMVRADMFDFIDRLMRYCKGYNKPFGGCQLIIVGDFYQLPPVVVGYENQQMKDAGFKSPFVFSSRVFEEGFKVIELTEVLRQKGDPKFLDLLDAARTGDVTPKQAALLNKQVKPTVDDLRIRLAGTNKQAEETNAAFLRTLAGAPQTFQATKFGEWPALPAEETLSLKIGAQIMVKQNAADRPPNFEGKYDSAIVNGTLGKVIEINDRETKVEDIVIPPNVKIEIDGGDTVTIYRQKWERKVKVKISEGRYEDQVVATYEQIPLALAWAISIHKSQGQSFEKVHIDASKIFAPGQLYVALSRCRSLNGLSLQSAINTRKFWANSDVTEFFENQKATV